MKRRRVLIGTLVLAAAGLWLAPAPGWSGAAASTRPAASGPANLMHPVVAPRDSSGVTVVRSGRPVSVSETCGSCHDSDYINAHSDHWNDRVHAGCADCHVAGGQLPAGAGALDPEGRYRPGRLRISSPTNENCARCHAIVHEGTAPVKIPEDFESPGDGLRDVGFTGRTGAIFSPRSPAESHLNLAGKAARGEPWDVHARRQVGCVDCHYAGNNPARRDVKRSRLPFLKDDPRRISISDFLHRPDHRLAAAGCRDCHEPLATHAFLPYAARHVEMLECTACHVPRLLGPAAELVDRTVVRRDGRPLILYRGMDRHDGEPLNAAWSAGYSPVILARRNLEGRPGRLGPFNAVEERTWTSRGEEVPAAVVRKAWLQDGAVVPVLVAAFDRNADGRLGDDELRLDTPERVELIRGRLVALGVADPVIHRTVRLNAVHHGIQSGPEVERDCQRCHAPDSRISGGLPLSWRGASAATPPVVLAGEADPIGFELRDDPARPALQSRTTADGRWHVFGSATRGWTGRAGFALFLAVALGVVTHALLRWRHRRPRPSEAASHRVYLYTTYERIWHWLMAVSIGLLLVTGIHVQFAGRWNLIPLPTAVTIHNFFAVVLTINAFLSLFYHLAAGAIRHLIPRPDGLADEVVEHARYYTRGIFLGQPHPAPRVPGRKLNPLQQLTYLVLLNLLFPFQVLTGALIWGVSRWPGLAGAIGGLTVVAPLHSLGSWLFLSFFLLHIYLTTTGRTVFANVATMVDGWAEVEPDAVPERGGSHG